MSDGVDRKAILDLIRTSPRPLHRRDIARALKIPPEDKRALTEALHDLVAEDRITLGPHRAYVAAAQAPEIAAVEIVRIDRHGEMIGRTVGLEPPIRDIRVLPGPGAAPGKGDRVQARLSRSREGWIARALRKIEAEPEWIVGAFEGGRAGGVIRPADRRVKVLPTVSAADAAGLKHGELVRAALVRERAFAPPRARILERLGAADAPRAVSLIAIHQHGIPSQFPPEALAEAAAARPVAPGPERADLRDLPLVTVDGADARDFDDAVFAEPDRDPANPGGWRLTVAIADVAHYVRPGSALDAEALKRGNSVYFPDRVVPMLPEALSNDLCSLRPHEDRACFAAHMTIDAHGSLLGHRFERGVMQSVARLTYEQAQAAFDGRTDDVTGPIRERAIVPLYGAYAALAEGRRRRATLDLDLPERKVHFGADGHIAAILPLQRLDSHKLIEEFMIAANVAAAEALEALRQPCMYRVHDPPDPEKLQALRPVLQELGLGIPPQGVTARHFNRVLEAVADKPYRQMVHQLILRSQMQAAYAPGNRGHFGLALPRYAHFTSPIRRYADLLVHRALVGPGKPDGVGRAQARDWEEVGEAISKTERRAFLAERDSFDRYLAAFMADRIGAEFAGAVSGVQRFGLFVQLAETGADGLLPVQRLPGGYYDHDPDRHTLSERATGRTFRLGDAVVVRLAEADRLTGTLAFDFVAHTPSLKPVPVRGGRPGRHPRRRR